MTKNKKVTVVCYNQVRLFKNSQEAFNFFVDCFRHCDPNSSEAARYMTILQKLLENKIYITDEEE